MLPMLDIDGSLREIEYAFDTLKADGIGLLTNYEDKWLGDPAFAPIFEELNRRKAIMYTHPTMPSCCVVPQVSNAITELGTDTTRTIMSLIVNKAPSRYPDIPFIFSHAGGIMPFVIQQANICQPGSDISEATCHTAAAEFAQFYEDLKRFYYDTAQADNSLDMAALRKVIPVSQILFGTDFPYGKIADEAVKNLKRMPYIQSSGASCDRSRECPQASAQSSKLGRKESAGRLPTRHMLASSVFVHTKPTPSSHVGTLARP